MQKWRSFFAITTIVFAAAELPGPMAYSSENLNPTAESPEVAMCTDEFVDSYLQTAEQFGIVEAFRAVNESPPNLIEASAACARFEKNFSSVTCKIASIDAEASAQDLKDGCEMVDDLYDLQYLGQPNTNDVIDAKDVTDSSSVARLEPARLLIGLPSSARNAELLEALPVNGVRLITDGKVLGLIAALSTETTVRCSINGSESLKLQAGEQLRLKAIEETFVSGYRKLVMTMADHDASIECSSSTGAPLKLGELKTAFGGLARIGYNK